MIENRGNRLGNHPCYYWGCGRPGRWEAGHYMHNPHWESTLFDTPFPDDINTKWDGGLLKKYEIQDVVNPNLHQVLHLNFGEEWTVLTFWDRSVDTRGACNSGFVVRGHHDFEAALKIAEEHFPARFVQWNEKHPELSWVCIASHQVDSYS